MEKCSKQTSVWSKTRATRMCLVAESMSSWNQTKLIIAITA